MLDSLLGGYAWYRRFVGGCWLYELGPEWYRTDRAHIHRVRLQRNGQSAWASEIWPED